MALVKQVTPLPCVLTWGGSQMIGLDAVWRNSVKCDVWKVLKTSFGMHLSINLDKKLVNVKSGSCPLPSPPPPGWGLELGVTLSSDT